MKLHQLIHIQTIVTVNTIKKFSNVQNRHYYTLRC